MDVHGSPSSSGSNSAKTGCQRRFKAHQEMETKEVESIFIPHGAVIFACHSVEDIDPQTHRRRYTPPSAVNPSTYYGNENNSNGNGNSYYDAPTYDYPPNQRYSQPNSMNGSSYTLSGGSGGTPPPPPQLGPNPHFSQIPHRPGPEWSAPSHHHQQVSPTTSSHPDAPFAWGNAPSPPNHEMGLHTAPSSQSLTSSNSPTYNWGGPQQTAPASPPMVNDVPPPARTRGGKPSSSIRGLTQEHHHHYTPDGTAAHIIRSTPSAMSGRTGGHPPLGVNKCASCGTTMSPEWRKGPSGKKDLCNA